MLKSKTVWLIGGRRVGQVVARKLAEQGANLFLTYNRSQEAATITAAAAARIGVKAYTFSMDASNQEQVEKAVEAGWNQFGRLDYCVNLASVFNLVSILAVTPADWQKNFNAHILGSFWPLQALAKRWIKDKKGGSIVLFSDRTSGGRPVYPHHLLYIVTKEAIAGMVRATAVELGEFGISINAIAPGGIEKPSDYTDQQWREILEKAPLRAVTDQEMQQQVAEAVISLLTAKGITGQILFLDRGQGLVAV